MTWFKLKDANEGDLIDIGFGTHVEYGMLLVEVAIALILLFFALLVALAY